MFKKSNKSNIRRRKGNDEENGDNKIEEFNTTSSKQAENKDVVNVKQSSIVSKKEKPKKMNKKKEVSLLSFGDEEDEETSFKIKKSSRSKRIAKQIKKRSQEEKESLGKNESKPSQPLGQENHVFQPQKAKNNEVEQNKFSLSTPKFDSDLTRFGSGAIPSPSMIHAARKQREMLRKFGSEYISMDDTQRYKEISQSRLVRDDDDDGSSDDGVVEMKGIETKKPNASRLLVPNESDDNVNSNEEDNVADEEVDRWEEEMIKKGINLPTNQAVNQAKDMTISQELQASAYANYNYVHSYYNNQTKGSTESNQIMYRNVQAKSDITFDLVKKRLQDHLTTLKQKNCGHKTEMERLALDMDECKEMSKNLGNIATISQEYQFYQEIRQYLRDLVDCLKENVPAINNLEQNAYTIWKSQSERLVKRRMQDVRDESSQNVPGANKANQDKINGQDMSFTQRVREREARRTRRRAARQIHRKSNHFDGMSTDDEETTMDQAQYNVELQQIQKAAQTTFDDVIEEFCSLNCVLQRFKEWKQKQPDSYNDAYIALCIPKLIVPLIRHTMIFWNPLLSTTAHFEEEEWFKTLALFGVEELPLDEDVESSSLDDAKVLSSVVEKVIVAKLVEFVSEVWDPLSSQQTIRLSLLLKHLTRGYPCMVVDNKLCQSLAQVLCKRLQTTLDNEIFIPLLPPSTSEDSAHAFLDRQTWTCIKLFKNAMLLDGMLSYEILCELAFDSLLNRYIVLALQTSVLNISCLYKCQRIVDSIPKSWFAKYENMSSHLKSLVRFLVHFAQTTKVSNELATKTLLKQIKTMLLVIGARDALAEI
ncbi:PAX3- and PAX7-binding protein 1-like [Clavelina lepadiformis]|uniref:PAX3- and PAX7-binding protein 1-like n=1 Tax=Clavelina lepadiformis TaxID=159417 RepID=UPI0040417B11